MEQLRLPHKLVLNDRRQLTVTGVTEVVSFDEEAVIVKIGEITLYVRGEDLHLNTLSLESGQVAVDGLVTEMVYEQGRSPAGFWHRLWG